jgi:hypothetical protein
MKATSRVAGIDDTQWRRYNAGTTDGTTGSAVHDGKHHPAERQAGRLRREKASITI